MQILHSQRLLLSQPHCLLASQVERMRRAVWEISWQQIVQKTQLEKLEGSHLIVGNVRVQEGRSKIGLGHCCHGIFNLPSVHLQISFPTLSQYEGHQVYQSLIYAILEAWKNEEYGHVEQQIANLSFDALGSTLKARKSCAVYHLQIQKWSCCSLGSQYEE